MVMRPEDLVVEVLHYWDNDDPHRGINDPPGWSVGSGFVLGSGLVLTAAHNVGDGEVLVRTGDSRWPATVRLRGDEESADLALLEISGGRSDVPRFRYGTVDRTVRGFVDSCWAVGFPAFKERVFKQPDAPARHENRTAHVSGRIPTLENLGHDVLTMRVDNMPAPERDRQVDQWQWSGMSGSVVFAGEDIVVGVISEHHRPEGSSSLAVVPITAIARLPDAGAWWELLDADPSGLVRLPLPAQRNDGLYVWTAADSRAGREVVADTGDVELLEAGQPVDVTALRRGQLPNLQLEFARLGPVFDDWVTPGPSRKRGRERLRVLWLVGEPVPERSRALLACLSRAGQQGRAVYDASRDLDLAAETLGRSVFAAGFALPPLISVDLKEDEPASPWRTVETAATNAGKQFTGSDGRHLRGDDPYPRMIVAGTVEQEAAAAKLLSGLVDIMAVDRSGRVQQREYALINQIPTGEHVYNRGLPITARDLYGRRREIQTFRRDWESEQIRVLSVVAYGGTGKSALVNAWLHDMQKRDYAGARKVLAWSFYSQGTKENLVSADLFVSTALSWLGDESPPSLNLWARGLQLARLIKRNRFLLVLDGLEPLQYPMTASLVGGQLTDDSIRALLEELAKPDWEGLCLITTRVPLTDLGRFQVDRDNPADQGTVDRLDLENLNEDDAADLLEHLIKTEADYRDLRAAVREVDCHALAITLLGNYLRDVHGGDLRGRHNLDRLTVDVREGGHARRIMATYATWLERNERFDELTILRLIGLFDRPADPDAMSALLADPQMRTFTGELEQGSDAWNDAVDALREMGLLNRESPDQPGFLDAHPLVREHFRYELRKDHPDWWLHGNRTLFGFYQIQAPPEPDNSKDMNWLYAAVTHGCAAGLHQQVFDEVLLKRVWRDRRTNFSTRRLGMTGSDLVALSNYFYPQQWTKLRTPSLSARARVLVLTNAGVRLRQLGRLVDARDSFGAVVREIDPQAAQAEELEDASYAAAAYCDLLVIAGKLKGGADESEGALFNGQQAVEFSNQGDDAYFSMHARISLAEVHFMLNDLEQANALFEQAMAIDRERRPRPPFLYSQGMYRYGYFLIETGRAEMILTGESQDPSWGKNGDDSSLLSEAIRLLILGAAHRALIEAGPRDPAFLRKGEQILNDAISAFQTAGYTDYTVRGLLERAHFYRVLRQTRYVTAALADLAKAAVEAKRGQMDLLYADVLLQQVACYLDEWAVMTRSERASSREKITDSLNLAAELVARIDYGRRQAMLDSLQEAAAKAGALMLPPSADM
jgi:tetratricopeptide (TPR) repeat protein